MDTAKVQDYILRMSPLLNKKAIYSDETEMFVSPMECDPGDSVTIRLRTAENNVDQVFLFHEEEKIAMHHDRSEDGFDYHAAEVRVGEKNYSYTFLLVQGKSLYAYGKNGLVTRPEDSVPFTLVPGLHTPDWAKGAVMYQIFLDRFRNGDSSNDVVDDEYSYIGEHVRRIEDWDQVPDAMDVRNFYGGDLAGVIEKLDYLEGLGVEVLYLNPIFVSPSNHKYDSQDYHYVDPHLGRIVEEEDRDLAEGDLDNRHARRYISRVTRKKNLEASNELFADLVRQAHSRGMKVILDGVFNHCGSFHKWLDREGIYEGAEGFERGAYLTADSPYRNYFDFKNPGGWPGNFSYDGWWGHDTLPKLNYEASEALQEEVLDIGRKWVSEPYCADGWRLDVAADLGHSPAFNHQFWKRFRRAVKEANPEAIVLAEHYGDPSAWLKAGEWGTVMNYDAFMEPVSWFFTGMEKHSDSYREDLLGNGESFAAAMRHHTTAFPMPSLLTAMNQLDNHDHSRFLTRTNHYVGRVQSLGSDAAGRDLNYGVLREAVLVQMTWPGAPTLYYGDEAGVVGFTDPDNRRTFPWGREDRELTEFYREAIRLHREHPVLRTGSVKILACDRNFLSFARFNREEKILVMVNNSPEAMEKTVEVWPAGMGCAHCDSLAERIFSTDREGYSTERGEVPVREGKVHAVLAPYSSLVLCSGKISVGNRD